MGTEEIKIHVGQNNAMGDEQTWWEQTKIKFMPRMMQKIVKNLQ